MENSMQEGVMKMLECYRVCTRTIVRCLEMGGEYASPERINVLMDCAKMCQLAADFAVRESDVHPDICELCADICDQCADECESVEEDGAELQRCATVCRECAQECRRMAA